MQFFLIQDDGSAALQPETDLHSILERCEKIHESAGMLGQVGVITIEPQPKQQVMIGYVRPVPTKKEVMDALKIKSYARIKAEVKEVLEGKTNITSHRLDRLTIYIGG